MSDDDRITTTTLESSGAPGTPGSDEPKTGYGSDVPSDQKPEDRPAGGGQGTA